MPLVAELTSADLPAPPVPLVVAERKSSGAIRPPIESSTFAPPKLVPQFLTESALPSTLQFAPTLTYGLKVMRPFSVRVEKVSEGVSVYVEDLDEFGYGNSLSEALADLARTIVELFRELDTADNLSPYLADIRAALQEHLKVKRF